MKRYVTWEEVEKFVDYICKELSGKISGVYAIPRGGLVLGSIISNRMNIPLLLGASKGCLVLDDICDTGESLIHYVKNSSGDGKGYLTATMFYKDNEFGIKPDYYMFTKNNDWIVFPWEEKED